MPQPETFPRCPKILIFQNPTSVKQMHPNEDLIRGLKLIGVPVFFGVKASLKFNEIREPSFPFESCGSFNPQRTHIFELVIK